MNDLSLMMPPEAKIGNQTQPLRVIGVDCLTTLRFLL